jgi:eukaryotic-like serine/threonine-protein kinase
MQNDHLPSANASGPTPASLAQTMIAPSHDGTTQVVPGDALFAASPPGGGTRSTILPRVEFIGEVPRLVVDARERFESAKVLGRGGVGEVMLARDNDIERAVAVKRLLPELDGGADIIARFVQEIRVLGRLDHPNIVPIHDVGIDADGRYFYVMKYVEGETLEHVIERLVAGDADYHRRYTFERRTEVFMQVLRGVQYAHAQGVLHRDLKPANIMVGRFGEVVVMDWGLARSRDEGKNFPVDDGATALMSPRGSQVPTDKLQTMEGTLLGTPAYMSPEQARGEVATLDERSDVYSLSVMFHELLTLEHYLASKNTVTECIAGVLTEPVSSAYKMVNAHQSRVPVEFAHFIRHGVAKNTHERFRSVTMMIDRLLAIRDGKVPVECTLTLVKRMGSESMHAVDRHPGRALMTVGISAVLILMGAGALLWTAFGALG